MKRLKSPRSPRSASASSRAPASYARRPRRPAIYGDGLAATAWRFQATCCATLTSGWLDAKDNPMSPQKYLLGLLAAALLFHSSGLLPGRVALPLDVLCWQLPWSNTPACSGITPKNPVISDVVLVYYPWREVIRRDGWGA